MAVYNGEKFLAEQLDSILPQLKLGDEIVISYDKSQDKTYEIITDYAKKCPKIKIVFGQSAGLIRNFENALLNCTNDYIFLCDQDDVWMPNKVDAVLDAFAKTGADLILHDAVIVDENLHKIEQSFFTKRKCCTGLFKNIVKNSYIGCCMAFKNEVKLCSLPFPKALPMHDQWIGLVAERFFKVHLLPVPLILYRRHANNASQMHNADILTMLKWRVNILKGLLFCAKKR